jgi:hypothetical protein
MAAIRGRIEELKSRLAWVETSPLAVAEAQENADRIVDRMAARFGLGDRAGYFFHDCDERVFAQEFNVLPHGVVSVDLGPMLAALFGDELKKRLHREIEARAEEIECGPPTAERKAARQTLERELFDAETAEEALIVAAEEAGMDGFFRRHDVNPACVLAITE